MYLPVLPRAGSNKTSMPYAAADSLASTSSGTVDSVVGAGVGAGVGEGVGAAKETHARGMGWDGSNHGGTMRARFKDKGNCRGLCSSLPRHVHQHDALVLGGKT